MNKFDEYIKLKSGTDIRGTAVETPGSPIQLTDEVVFDLVSGFALWLKERGIAKHGAVAVGHDSRISAKRIETAAIRAFTDCGFNVFDCALASTPAMFMATLDLPIDASLQITASHHPFDRNGLKFFTPAGGLDHADIIAVVEKASEYEPQRGSGKVEKCDYMVQYAKRLRDKIKREVNAENFEKPLKGMKIAVDAGNGVGGFYATEVLQKLGADISGSRYLEPDGMFPFHAPNPENKAAMESIREATLDSGSDLGIIFDTDVDRAGCVDKSGNEINRNRLIALAAVIALEGNDGATIVTDSVTSTGLTEFIQSKGGVHYRYRRGYKNVINKQIELNSNGINCPLAIETSGHGAFRENYYLDDGAYLMTKIVILLAKQSETGKGIEELISTLKEPKEEKELRPGIKADDFKKYGEMVINELEKYAEGKDGWRIADDNREGVRIYLHGGWMLLRLSVHDPIMPFNAESDEEGGVARIVKDAYEFLKQFEKLDLSCFEGEKI